MLQPHYHFFVKINLNCAHAVHILWSCKLSVAVWLPAESRAKKNACTHGSAKCFGHEMSVTWLTLMEYAAISSLADCVKWFASYVCLSDWFSYRPAGRQRYFWQVHAVHIQQLDVRAQDHPRRSAGAAFQGVALASLPAFLSSTCSGLWLSGTYLGADVEAQAPVMNSSHLDFNLSGKGSIWYATQIGFFSRMNPFSGITALFTTTDKN